jgi:uncharacterized protein
VSFSERQPYFYALILVAVVFSVLVLAGFVTTGLNLHEIGLYLMANICLSVIAAVLLTRGHWWKEIGFRSASSNRDFWLFALPVIPIGLNASGGFHASSAVDVLLFFALAALVGFVEESFFRGLMLRPLALRGRWRAAVITSLVFGLVHSQHLLRGTDPEAVLTQIVFAVSVGFAYAALVLRTGMIWPLMILHCLTDFAAFTAAGGLTISGGIAQEIITSIIYFVVLVGYGIWLLWYPSRLRYASAG